MPTFTSTKDEADYYSKRSATLGILVSKAFAEVSNAQAKLISAVRAHDRVLTISEDLDRRLFSEWLKEDAAKRKP